MKQNNSRHTSHGDPVLAQNLLRIMAEKNMSEAYLAEKMGISRQAINKIINLQTNPSLCRLRLMASVLGVSPCNLMAEWPP